MRVTDIRINHMPQPLGVDEPPRFSWKIKSEHNGVVQTAYRIVVTAGITTASFHETTSKKTGKTTGEITGKTTDETTGAAAGMVAFSPDACICDTGWIAGSQSVGVEIGDNGKFLPCTRYQVEISVRDNYGEEASTASSFETGLMTSHWPAGWITHEFPEDDTTCPVFCRDVVIRSDQRIIGANAYVTVLGVYELAIDGQKAGDAFLAPGWTAYEKRLQYQTYDITDQLVKAQNQNGTRKRTCTQSDTLDKERDITSKTPPENKRIAAENSAGSTPYAAITGEQEIRAQIQLTVGNGWYKGYLNGAGKNCWYGNRVAVSGVFRIAYADGTVDVIMTDPDWAVQKSEITYSELYHGETQDLRKRDFRRYCPNVLSSDESGQVRSQSGSKVRTADKSSDKSGQAHSQSDPDEGENNRPSQAVFFTGNVPAQIISQQCEPVRITQRIPAVRKLRTPKGELVIDFGQNIAGFVEVRLPKLPCICTDGQTEGDTREGADDQVKNKAEHRIVGNTNDRADVQIKSESDDPGAALHPVRLRIRHAETLDRDGNFYTENLRTAKATDCYIYDPQQAGKLVHPHFTYHGFRYICIEYGDGLTQQTGTETEDAGKGFRRDISKGVDPKKDSEIAKSQKADIEIGRYNQEEYTGKSGYHQENEEEKGSEKGEDTGTIDRINNITDAVLDKLDLSDFTACVLHTDMRPAGEFHCSNPLVEQLQSNIRWSQRDNFVDIPTDCPQRDERLGWTGDAEIFAPTAVFNYDTESFYLKWMRDLMAESDNEHGVPQIVPQFEGHSIGTSVWSDAATVIPWTVYMAYGDPQILKEQYPNMRRWVDWVTARCDESHLWMNGFQRGDWLSLDGDESLHTMYGGTDRNLVANCYYAQSLQILRDTARVLGQENDAAYYGSLYETVRAAINREYVTAAGRIVSETQTACVLLLHFGLLEEKYIPRVRRTLAENLQRHQGHLTTGFIGTAALLPTLSDNDMHPQAEDILLTEDYPGWLYAVKRGATTIWERWNSILPDGTFDTSGMNSLNHYSYGSVGQWLYQTVGGITPLEPGYHKIRIAPVLTKTMEEVQTTLESPYGQIACHLLCRKGKVTMDVTIPANTTAKIALPGVKEGSTIRMQDIGTEGTEGIEGETAGFMTGSTEVVPAILTLGSGHYRFLYDTDADLTPLRFDMNTKIGDLLDDPAGHAAFDQFMSGTTTSPMINFLRGKTLSDLAAMAPQQKDTLAQILAAANKR